MFGPDVLQGSRYELKYLVTESCARAIRDFALSYLVPDSHDDTASDSAYNVYSLYLDTPSLALCRATMQGYKNRFKLRIRFYDDSADSPAFLEVKRRLNDVIYKQRVVVRRPAVARLLAGHWPAAGDVLDGSPRGHAALAHFCDLRVKIQAVGQVFVSYRREAYVTEHDNSVRLTFDRVLCGVRYDGSGTLRRDGEAVYPPVEGVVMELKFTDRFPLWMHQMVRSLSLERCSMAKYVSCVTALRVLHMEWA
jgi:hypothetical protein